MTFYISSFTATRSRNLIDFQVWDRYSVAMSEIKAEGGSKHISRRGFIKSAAAGIGLGIAGRTLLSHLDKSGKNPAGLPPEPTPEMPPPTPEPPTAIPKVESVEQTKEDALVLLEQFMSEHTTSHTVSDFVKGASAEEKERAFVL